MFRYSTSQFQLNFHVTFSQRLNQVRTAIRIQRIHHINTFTTKARTQPDSHLLSLITLNCRPMVHIRKTCIQFPSRILTQLSHRRRTHLKRISRAADLIKAIMFRKDNRIRHTTRARTQYNQDGQRHSIKYITVKGTTFLLLNQQQRLLTKSHMGVNVISFTISDSSTLHRQVRTRCSRTRRRRHHSARGSTTTTVRHLLLFHAFLANPQKNLIDRNSRSDISSSIQRHNHARRTYHMHCANDHAPPPNEVSVEPSSSDSTVRLSDYA